MPRTQAEIWADIQANNTQAMALQDEMNSTIDTTPPEPPIEPPIEPPVRPERSDYLYGVLPTASRTIVVENPGQITSKLALAKPGDHLAFKPGNYDDAINMTVDGQEGYPILLTAPDGGVTMSKTVSLTGKWCGVSGFTFVGDSRKIDAKNVGGRVTRCTFKGTSSDLMVYDGIVYMTGGAHPKVMIDFNRWEHIRGAAIRSEITDISRHQYMKIGYNSVFNHSILGDNESVMLILMDCYHDGKMQYAYNRFDTVGRNYQDIGQAELISAKTTDIEIVGTTIVKSGGMYISGRVSNKLHIHGSWLRDGAYIGVHGDDHLIENNDAGDKKVIDLYAGDCTMDSNVPDQCKNDGKVNRCPIVYRGGCKGGMATVRRATLKNNKGAIKVGTRYGSDKPIKLNDINLINNSERASVVSGSVLNFSETGIGNNETTAKETTAAMVGPNAPAPA
jgi:hypothetical protein